MMKVKEEMILRVVKEFIQDVRFKTLKGNYPAPIDEYNPTQEDYHNLWLVYMRASEELSSILKVIERFLDED